MLEVSELTTSFPIAGRQVPIVDGVSFSLEQGKCLALVGESGSGKSMTALSLMRLVPRPGRISSGSVRLEGQELLGLTVPEMRAVRGRRIAMIFQEPMTCLNPVVRVGEQVVEAIRLHERVEREAAKRRTLELFDRVGIPEPGARYDYYPHQLSGGLKQRVMIAMALSTQPRILVADEPTTALDVTIQAQILELLNELRAEFSMAILLITHDLGVVSRMADEVAVLYTGRVVEQASAATLLARPEHPYTRGLLASLPSRHRPGEKLHEIPGVVPSPAHWPAGCRFATRCSEVFERCPTEVPRLLPLHPDQRAACFAREGRAE
ncbi:MAG TPA: ABC transporter ATP-binding protein [Polyangiaceae bacterium]|nr:ABC transporter ATP-binding protein [Polyangiaceae bacterium]